LVILVTSGSPWLFSLYSRFSSRNFERLTESELG
jgi:hypothetical protein